MKKLFSITTLCFLLAIFSTLAGMYYPDNIWDNLQKILKKPNNQADLIRLRDDCRLRKLTDSTYAQILQRIAESSCSNPLPFACCFFSFYLS